MSRIHWWDRKSYWAYGPLSWQFGTQSQFGILNTFGKKENPNPSWAPNLLCLALLNTFLDPNNICKKSPKYVTSVGQKNVPIGYMDPYRKLQ